MHWVARSGHKDVLQQFLDRGADPNMASLSGFTPPREAAYKGHKAVVQLLQDRGAEPNMVSHHGFTPLHKAAIEGHKYVVQLLLDRGWTKHCRSHWKDSTIRGSSKGPHGCCQCTDHWGTMEELNRGWRFQLLAELYYCTWNGRSRGSKKGYVTEVVSTRKCRRPFSCSAAPNNSTDVLRCLTLALPLHKSPNNDLSRRNYH